MGKNKKGGKGRKGGKGGKGKPRNPGANRESATSCSTVDTACLSLAYSHLYVDLPMLLLTC